MRSALNHLYRLSGYGAAGCVFIICAIVIVQVLLNLINGILLSLFGVIIGNIPSYTDFTGYFLAAASFLALAYTFREGEHIRVTLALQYVPKPIQTLLEGFCLLVAASFTSYLSFYMALLVHESYIYEDVSGGMVPMPIWFLQSFLLIGLLILTIALWDDISRFLRGKRPSYLVTSAQKASLHD